MSLSIGYETYKIITENVTEEKTKLLFNLDVVILRAWNAIFSGGQSLYVSLPVGVNISMQQFKVRN